MIAEEEQVKDAIAAKGSPDLEALLRGNSTWEI
jgi:hypothetical protein